MLTFASLTTAPLESVTVPFTPAEVWANSCPQNVRREIAYTKCLNATKRLRTASRWPASICKPAQLSNQPGVAAVLCPAAPPRVVQKKKILARDEARTELM